MAGGERAVQRETVKTLYQSHWLVSTPRLLRLLRRAAVESRIPVSTINMTTNVAPEGLYLPTDITPEQLFKAIGRLRKAAQDEIDRLLAFLDSTEMDSDFEPDLAGYDRGMDDREGPDPDMEPDTHDEPSLGFSTGGHYPENQMQDGPGFYMNTDAGRGLEDEHDGAEPDVDGEASLGWTSTFNQTSASWTANHLGTIDLEDGVGAVRKKRPVSRTGNRVLVGVEVF